MSRSQEQYALVHTGGKARKVAFPLAVIYEPGAAAFMHLPDNIFIADQLANKSAILKEACL